MSHADLLPRRRADGAQAALRSLRRRPSSGRRQSAATGSTSGSTCWRPRWPAGMTAERARRPRARLRPAVLLGQGPGQHARLHGRERPDPASATSSSPASSPGWSRRVGPCSTCAPQRSTPRGHPRAASTCPLDSLRDDLGTLGNGPFVVYCEVGQRGHTATTLLHELGFKARNLDGGYRTWAAWEAAEAGAPRRLVGSAP